MSLTRSVCALACALFAVTLSFAGAYDDSLIAAREGRIEDLAGLISRGLDVNTSARDGTTLLGIAVRAGDMKTIEMLLANRASPNRRNLVGDTPILFAAIQGRLDIVKHLHLAGAELDPSGSWSVLHYAVYGNHVELIDYALANGADIERRAPNQRTALMLAAQNGSLELVKLLIRKGASASSTDSDKQNARQIALAQNFIEIASFLANVSEKSPAEVQIKAPVETVKP